MERPFSPACERNKRPILGVISDYLRSATRVLEIGSGTGQHAVFFAEQLPHLQWQPSDRPGAESGLEQWIEAAALPNLSPPLELDVTQQPWPIRSASAVFSANTCHIMSWAAVCSLFEGVAGLLSPGGRFLLYGPFNRGGQYTSASNAQFDASLRAADSERGLRDREALESLAQRCGLELEAEHPMPAHNELLVWRVAEGPGGDRRRGDEGGKE